MKTHPRPARLHRLALALALVLTAGRSASALTPQAWRFSQSVGVPAAGLVRVELPPATLDAARAGLEVIRLLDETGAEVPYLVERPTPQPERFLRAKQFRSSINPASTSAMIETGTTQALAGFVIESPGAARFIKAVRIEGSHEGNDWRELAAGQPIFRFPGGGEQLRLSFPEGAWEFLRLAVDDSRTQPIPITGASLVSAESLPPTEPLGITIKSRDESPGVTRLALDLGAANLSLASIRIETTDPLFTRPVALAVSKISEDGIRERLLCESVIYRVDLDGKSAERLEVKVRKPIPTRELVLLIHNQDSPPLAIAAVCGERWPVRLVFFARTAGRYTLLCGNSQADAPRYDLSQLAASLNGAIGTDLAPSDLAANPGYRAPEALASLPLTGASIDVTPWKFRKPIQLTGPGAQQLELDLDVLAKMEPDRRDLRLVKDGRHVPFLIERPSISRSIPLDPHPANDPKNPTLSRWSIALPRKALPITRLVCASGTPLFDRNIRLWEEVTGERGEKYPRELGRAQWKQVPDQPHREFVLTLSASPVTDTLLFETENGDNPPIDLKSVRGYYPVTRVVFKSSPDAASPLWLYYGNPIAAAPSYDLSLVAGQLLRAEQLPATAGSEENVASTFARTADTLTGARRYIFWGALAIVVIALLALIARLLPRAE